MIYFNHIYLVSLLVCGICYLANLHAESAELTTKNIDFDEIQAAHSKRDALIKKAAVSNPYNELRYDDEDDIYDEDDDLDDEDDDSDDDRNIADDEDDDIADDSEEDEEEMACEAFSADETRQQDTIEEEAANLQTSFEDSFDAMVDEMVESGAVDADITSLESQPQWKQIMARLGSYALSMSVYCKQIAANIYSSMQNTLASYWPTKK